MSMQVKWGARASSPAAFGVPPKASEIFRCLTES
jgi:hypothetical protein